MSANIQEEARKIVRKNTEEEIHEHLKAIRNIYLKYNPDGDYLSMLIMAKKGHIAVNNSFYDRDKNKPIDNFWTDTFEEESTSEEVPFEPTEKEITDGERNASILEEMFSGTYTRKGGKGATSINKL